MRCRFHLAVLVYSDNARMTSKRCKNKEVRHEPQASSVTDVLTTFSRPQCVISVHLFIIQLHSVEYK